MASEDVLERLEQVAQGLGRGWREDLIRDLAAALREARKDSERLDWLATQFGCALVENDSGRWVIAYDGMQNCPPDDDPDFDFAGTFIVDKGKWTATNPREAIDAEMGGEGE